MYVCILYAALSWGVGGVSENVQSLLAEYSRNTKLLSRSWCVNNLCSATKHGGDDSYSAYYENVTDSLRDGMFHCIGLATKTIRTGINAQRVVLRLLVAVA